MPHYIFVADPYLPAAVCCATIFKKECDIAHPVIRKRASVFSQEGRQL